MTDNNLRRRATMWLSTAGLLLVMAGTLMPLLQVAGDAYKYIYSAGAAMVLIGRIMSPSDTDNLRLKRLMRIEVWSGIFFCVGAFFLFYHHYGIGPNDWIAFTLAGGIIQIYTSVMIPRVSRSKE